jgi:C-terminal processing protease CtpA/Prc
MAMSTAELLEAALAKVGEDYIFEDKAAEVVELVRGKLADGAYDGLDGPQLCDAVTGHFQDVTRDKHLRLKWEDEPQSLEEQDAQEGDRRFEAAALEANYGVQRAERLEGNIGFVDIRLFPGLRNGAAVISAAMTIVARTRALIFDLRYSRGGWPAAVAYWNSFLFPDDEPVHLNDIYERKSGETRQFWTFPHVSGPRYLGRSVYVLTSSATFSGAEEFAYNLQALGRATLIGESTRGGAHPTTWHQLTEHIAVTVPVARSINPVTGTNWEGVGVLPDIEVPAAEAFDRAYQEALAHVGAAAPSAG